MVHELSKAIADCGGSISESRMTSLGNEFAMLLLVNGNWHTLAKLEGEFKKLADATGMNIQLRRTEERAARNDMLPYSIDAVDVDVLLVQPERDDREVGLEAGQPCDHHLGGEGGHLGRW